MILTLREKIALIYTSAGTQRNVAAKVGISHQKIGRILKAGFEGGYPLNSKVLTDPTLSRAVNSAFRAHTKKVRRRAEKDNIPFSEKFPVFYARMPKVDGTPGDRIVATHTHWLPDRLRNAWIGWLQETRLFYAISGQSIIELEFYNNRAEISFQGVKRTETQKLFRREFAAMRAAGLKYIPVNTPYTKLDASFPLSDVIADLDEKFRTKHEPAATTDYCKIGSQYLLQIDTTNKDTNTNVKTPKPRQATRVKNRPS